MVEMKTEQIVMPPVRPPGSPPPQLRIPACQSRPESGLVWDRRSNGRIEGPPIWDRRLRHGGGDEEDMRPDHDRAEDRPPAVILRQVLARSSGREVHPCGGPD